jgi:hypothetical protein
MGLFLRRLSLMLIVLSLSSVALASVVSHDRTQFGHEITVNAGEQVSDVTCFGCTVHIRGRVSGDVTTFGGNVFVENEGEVGGDTTVFGGDLRLEAGSKVKALTLFGGRIRRDPAATVSGDVTTFAGGAALWLFIVFGLPLLFLAAFVALIVWIVRRFTRPSIPVAARA